MAELSDLYSTRIMELAGALTKAQRLSSPDASATAHSKLCGSTITVDLALQEGRVSEFGQSVRACLLGQASASVLGREILGSSPDELRAVGQAMREMLQGRGIGPQGRWADLAALEPVRAVKARHASTLLVFEAVEKALDAIEQKEAAGAKAAQ